MTLVFVILVPWAADSLAYVDEGRSDWPDCCGRDGPEGSVDYTQSYIISYVFLDSV